MKATTEQKETTRKDLLKYLKPGTTVYTILRHVSASGMSRRIDVVIFDKKENRPLTLTWDTSVMLGYRISNRGGLVVSGCVMDMGFSVVYNLSQSLYPKGFKIPKGMYGRNGDTSGYDKDGGYALKKQDEIPRIQSSLQRA